MLSVVRRTSAVAAVISLLLAMPAQALPRVLVYTATAGYRHDSIPTAIQTLGELGPQYNVSFDFTEDRTRFTDDGLSGYDGLCFVSNSDQVLDDDGEAALQRYFQRGGAFIGVHSASACLQNDSTYQQAVGAIFDYHPQLQTATFQRLNTTHPATAPVPDNWTYEEEVYQFRSDPRSVGAEVIMTVNESSYTNDGTSTGNYPSQGTPHPIAWYIESPQSAQPLGTGASKAGRSFYTSLGHLNSTWQNATFQQHVMGGLTWALEGASTRAYGVGLVGNASAGAGSGNSTSDSTQNGDGASQTRPSGSSAPTSQPTSGASQTSDVGSLAKVAGSVVTAAMISLKLLL